MPNEIDTIYRTFAHRERRNFIIPGISRVVFPQESRETEYRMQPRVAETVLSERGFEPHTLLVVGCVTYRLFVTDEVRQTGFAFSLENRHADGGAVFLEPERGDVPAASFKVIQAIAFAD